MTVPVIAIVGPSDSGKTRVAAALIQTLVGQGYRIAAVKHCLHGHQVDRPNTDSARLFEAGAAQIVLSSPGQITSIGRTEADTALEEIVASLDPGYDLVVAEGFKESAVPKVLVLGAEELSPPPYGVIAVVGARGRAGDVPCYSFQELDGLAKQVQKQLMARVPGAPGISLVVDGVAIPLAPFPGRVLAGLIRGFLKELRGLPPSPGRVRLTLGTSATSDVQDRPTDPDAQS